MTDKIAQNLDDDLEIDPGRRRALLNLGLTVGLAYAVPVILGLNKASADDDGGGDGGDDGDGGGGDDGDGGGGDDGGDDGGGGSGDDGGDDGAGSSGGASAGGSSANS